MRLETALFDPRFAWFERLREFPEMLLVGALLLGRWRVRLCSFERRAFPRPYGSTEGLHQVTVRLR